VKRVAGVAAVVNTIDVHRGPTLNPHTHSSELSGSR
jgi:hypothetical protein